MRLSGPGAFEVAAGSVEGFRTDRPRVATLATFRILTASRSITGSTPSFPAPHSYTGEDMVELSCHGGLLAPARLLAALHAAGARPGAAGEFTRRAVLNGKLDLVQAEAVGDLIDATAPAQARAALRQLDGGLSRRIAELRESLVELQALLSYEIDFPERTTARCPPVRIAAALEALPARIGRLLATAPSAERLRAGSPAGAGRAAERRQVVALQRAARHRARARHRDPGHDARYDRSPHRLPRLAGPAGGHRRPLGLPQTGSTGWASR